MRIHEHQGEKNSANVEYGVLVGVVMNEVFSKFSCPKPSEELC